MPGFLIPDAPILSLDDYLAAGGNEGMTRALEIGPDAVIEEVRAAGLRGRGGAGFPTGIKWRGLRGEDSDQKYVVCNAAEGEPGTFKDRWLLRHNPYQLLEGLAVAAFSVGAVEAYIGIKARFGTEVEALKRALGEMSEAGYLGDLGVGVVEGPDDYLFGEEKAMLEVIEGKDPLPRLYPPYILGLFAGDVSGVGAGSVGGQVGTSNPTLVNNVETLSNVPHILANGSSWFRSMGTDDSPGTMVFTVSGDVGTAGIAELELGTPLSFLVYGVGGGLARGRSVKAAVSGVSNRPITADALETPLSFEGMRSAGSGLGSGGFIVYDDTACMVGAGAVLSRFLADGSCGQCPPCKLGTAALASGFATLGSDGDVDLDDMTGWVVRVTDANRCGLGAGQQVLAQGILEDFPGDVAAHLAGSCDLRHDLPLPMFTDYDPATGTFQ